MFKNFQFSKALALVCLSGLILSCERKMDESTKLKIQLPHTAANQMYSKAGISAQTVGGGTSWGVADPSVFDDISCFAIAVEAPDLNQYQCKRSDGTIAFRPGVLVGAFPAGEQIIIEVPAGPDRRIHAIGFAATSLSACTNFDVNDGPDKANLSAPHMLGSVKKDLEPGDNTVVINASLSAAGKFHDCDKPNFGDQPGSDPHLTVADNIMVNEGSSFDLSFYLPGPAQSDVTFDVLFSGNTATYPTDILSAFGNPLSLTIAAGAQNVVIQLVAPDDASVEGNETFNYQISNAVGAFVPVTTFSGTVLDNDVAAPATQMVFTGNPTVLAAGAYFTATLEIQDGGSTIVSGGADSTANVTLSLTSGSGTLAGTVTKAAVGGVVTFTATEAVYLDMANVVEITATKEDTSGSGGTAAMTATLSGLTVNHGPASQLGWSVQPANTVAGNVISATVQVLDAFGNIVTTTDDATATITMSLTTGTGTLGGTVSKVATAGVVSFGGGEGLNIQITGSKSLTATKSDESGTDGTTSISQLSGAFNINHGPASQMVFTTQPGPSVATGAQIDSVVEIRDTYGNVVTTGADATAAVSMSLSSGTGTLSGTTTKVATLGAVNFGAGESLNIGTTGSKILTATKADTSGGGGTGVLNVNSSMFSVTGGATPNLSVLDSMVAEGSPFSFDFILDTTAATDITISFNVSSGTAMASGTDFNGPPGGYAVTITSGATIASHVITTVQDSTDEPTETMDISISSAPGASIVDGNAVGTINDDDAPPTIGIDDVSNNEGIDLVFVGSLSQPSALNIDFLYSTYDMSATGGTDYVSASSSISIPAGSTFFSITITSNGDATVEPDETFMVSLYSATNATFLDDVAIGTINNDDVGGSALTLLDVAMTEGFSAPLIFSISPPSASQVVVSFNTYDGTATSAGSDYVSISDTVTIGISTPTFFYDVYSSHDVTVEGDETFYISISSVTGATIATPGVDDMALVTIYDDDLPTLSISDASGTEGQTLSFLVTMNFTVGSSVTFEYYTSNNTAASPGDFGGISFPVMASIAPGQASFYIDIPTVDDGTSESTEYFDVYLQSLSGAVAGDIVGTGSIIDNDAGSGLYILDTTVTEGGTASMMFSLSAVSGSNVDIGFTTYDSSAFGAGVDYYGGSFSVQIPAGQTFATFDISTADDGVSESPEIFMVSIDSASNATIVDGSAIVTINDDDNTPGLWMGSPLSVVEGQSAIIDLNLDASSASDVTLFFMTADGSAVAGGGDYVSFGASVTIAAGQTILQIPITTNDDGFDEFEEFFNISLSSLGGASLIGSGFAAISISDNDPEPSIHISDATTLEGGSVDFQVSLSQISGRDVYFNYSTYDILATSVSNSDYQNISWGMTIPAGSLVYNLAYPFFTTDDTIFEPVEDFGVTLTSLVNLNVSLSDVAAKIVIRDNDGWGVNPIVKASNANASDLFGSAVNVDGTLFVVGVQDEDSNQTTITQGGGASADNSNMNSGAAYVYQYVGGSHLQQAYLKPSNSEAGDGFGNAVAVDGNLVAVAASTESSNQTTITQGGGASTDNTLTNAGAVYLFRDVGGTWIQEAYLKPSHIDNNDYFGYALAASSDKVAVGAKGEASVQTYISVGQTSGSTDNTGAYAGAVYIFQNMGGTWEQKAMLKPSNSQGADQFGAQVDMFGSLVVVGAPEEDSNQTFVTNGGTASNDNSSAASGAAYIFRHTNGDSWVQEAYLKASNAEAGDSFGSAVAAFENLVAVGAPLEDSNQNFPSQGGIASANNTLNNAGAVYVYENMGGSWVQQAYLKPSNISADDQFGMALAATHNTVVVGVPYEDSSATAIDFGPYAPSDDTLTNAGAVYVFQKDAGSWQQASYIKPPTLAAADSFGKKVSMDGDLLVVGAEGEDGIASQAGAAYYYNWRGPIQAAVARAPTQIAVTATQPMDFHVRFSRPINPGTFVVGDLVNSGTATSVTWNIINSGDNMNFTIQATGGTTASGDTYLPSIPVGMVQDNEGMGNDASFTLGPSQVTCP